MMLLLPRFGQAHTLGLSTAELTVHPDGGVSARLVFPTAESLGDLRLDRAGDGNVDAADVEVARGALAAFVRDGVDVTADDEACPGTFDGASLTEVDGLELRATYACPPGASSIGLTLYYLSRLPPGHRELARIALDPAPVARSSITMVEAVLRGDHRALVLNVPPSLRQRRSLVARAAYAVLALPTPVALASALLGAMVLLASVGRGWAVRRRRP